MKLPAAASLLRPRIGSLHARRLPRAAIVAVSMAAMAAVWGRAATRKVAAGLWHLDRND